MKVPVIKNALLQIPPEIKYFLIRAILIFVAWQLLYYLILYPANVPDKQLTQVTAWQTGFLYQHLVDKQTSISFESKPGGITRVFLNGRPSISIAEGCNALGLYVLYVAILFCFKAPLKRKIFFSLAGCALIFILNGIRCFLLARLFVRKAPFFDFAHHYIFTLIIYVLIFFMWTIFIKKLKNAA